MPTPLELLQAYWGYDQFRPLQESIISTSLGGRDVLALLATGSGKSLCYQVPALLMPGLTLVVSPLIALMQDQVDALVSRDIPAAALHSGQSWKEGKPSCPTGIEGAGQTPVRLPRTTGEPGFRGVPSRSGHRPAGGG